MNQLDKIEKKVHYVHLVGGIIIGIICLFLLCPPLIALWDRNDIWIGAFPLSQLCIFVLPILAGVVLMAMYFIEGRYVEESDENLNEDGDEA